MLVSINGLNICSFFFFLKEDKGNSDPDKLLQCPFDKNHQIRACRFPYHLIKCKKVSRELVYIKVVLVVSVVILFMLASKQSRGVWHNVTLCHMR